jgi:hypothetical protein
VQEKQLREILDWLKPLDMEASLDTVLQLRQQGTCEWLLESEMLKEWKDSTSGSFLWLHGIRTFGRLDDVHYSYHQFQLEMARQFYRALIPIVWIKHPTLLFLPDLSSLSTFCENEQAMRLLRMRSATSETSAVLTR